MRLKHMFEINCPRSGRTGMNAMKKEQMKEDIRRINGTQHIPNRFFRSATSIKQGDHHFKVHNERNPNEYLLARHSNGET